MCSVKYFCLVMDHDFCLPFSVSYYENIWLCMEIYGYMVVYMALYGSIYIIYGYGYIHDILYIYLLIHTVHRYKL